MCASIAMGEGGGGTREIKDRNPEVKLTIIYNVIIHFVQEVSFPAIS